MYIYIIPFFPLPWEPPERQKTVFSLVTFTTGNKAAKTKCQGRQSLFLFFFSLCFFFGYFYYRKQSSKNKVLPSRTPVSFFFSSLCDSNFSLLVPLFVDSFFSFFLFFFYCRELSGGKLAAAEVAGCSAVGTRHYAKPCALAYSQEGVLYRMCSL